MVTIVPPVPDTKDPLIIPPSPLIYEFKTTGNTLTWVCSDDHPYAYEISINNTDTGFVESLGYFAWHGENITYSFDGLAEGNWEAILTLYDLSSNKATSVVQITVIPPLPDNEAPLISKPADLTIAENTAGTIIWEVDDKHPAYFTIAKNGTVIFTQNHWNPGIVQYHFTSLPLGTWFFNLTCFDESGNSAYSIAVVRVLPGNLVDTTGPQISHHPDVSISYNDTGTTILTVYLFDEHPAGYQVSLSSGNVVADNPNWVTPNIVLEIHLEGLYIGKYNLNITAWDTFGNTNSRFISVTVIGDITPPIISSPPDITAYEGSNITIKWTIDEPNPSHCKVLTLPTGNIVTHSDPFSSNEYIFTIQLKEGTYNYRFIVYDLSGNYAFDDVLVTIKKPKKSPGFEILVILPLLLVLVAFRKNFFIKRRLIR
ncbi:MAG: hypothetical protein ACTSW1_04730 [Candidatus Hodarchaeales archaeon]